jgi:hypothetical protein
MGEKVRASHGAWRARVGQSRTGPETFRLCNLSRSARTGVLWWFPRRSRGVKPQNPTATRP